jgi:hypothetical protein
VKGIHSGTITEDGLYTAPNEPGIYEVSATSVENPEIKAVLYIIVKKA